MKKTAFLMMNFMSILALFADTNGNIMISDSSTPYDKVQGKEILPTDQKIVKEQVMPFVVADYLMWYVNQEGLEFALTGSANTTAATSNNTLATGQQFDPPGKLNSGFRVGAGLNTSYDDWEIGAYFTWIKSQSSTTMPFVSSPTYFIPNNYNNHFLRSFSDVNDQSVKGGYRNFKLYFNAFDLLLSKRVFFTPKILLNPYAGLKGTYQKHDVESKTLIQNGYYNNNGTDYNGVSGSTLSKVTTFNGGIGPKIGFTSIWKISRKMGILADLGFSNLWIWSKSKRVDLIPQILSSQGSILLSNFTMAKGVRTKKTLNQVFETKLGFEYETYFSHQNYRFKAGAFWEGQVWFNQMQYAWETLPNANLILQGLTLNLRLDF